MTAPFALTEASAVIPAELSFLTIYNPSLGDKDENLRDQIVFYTSKESRTRRKRNDYGDDDTLEHEEENERLRQVGLAQGMVSFARNFSDGKPVDNIETEKSRIIIHELETGWWILASINLTRLPQAHTSDASKGKYEYSSREVAPPPLLLQQLIRAHSIFLLHHAASLSDLWVRLTPTKFCALLDRFWSRFIWKWNVLLHGNPAVDVFNGTKLSAGGELGIGVGEEEWGSGEREVLEDFVARTEGLVDLVVSRYGDAPPEGPQREAKTQGRSKREAWLGTGSNPRPSDGVLFSGVGALSKSSLATVSQWMEWIYKHGSDAYGVGESPSSAVRRRKRRAAREPGPRRTAIADRALSPGIPPPIVRAVDQSLEGATAKAQKDQENGGKSNEQKPSSGPERASSPSGTDTMMKYLTLGYGSAWNFPGKGLQRRKSSTEDVHVQDESSHVSPEVNSKLHDPSPEEKDDEPLKEIEPTPEYSDDDQQVFRQRFEESIGRFLIGLSGDLENEAQSDGDEPGASKDNGVSEDQRISIRTITVEMADKQTAVRPSQDPDPDPEQSPSRHHKIQVLIYVHQPFIFTFLFALHTSSLAYPSFYRSVHHQLGPLQKPLLSSTDPSNVAQRIEAAMGESHHSTSTPLRNGSSKPSSAPPFQSIHDLIYDPRKHTVHTSIANIPAPGTLAAEGLQPPTTASGSWLTLGIPTSSSSSKPASSLASGTASLSPWTRITALNVHTQILNMYIATRSLPNEVERTSKTSRGWWVLWMRIPHQRHVQSVQSDDEEETAEPLPPREAFLVRQATEGGSSVSSGSGTAGGARKVPMSVAGKGFGLLSRERDGAVAGGSGTGPSTGANVVEGIGVDARRWVEGLLALNR